MTFFCVHDLSTTPPHPCPLPLGEGETLTVFCGVTVAGCRWKSGRGLPHSKTSRMLVSCIAYE